MELKIERLSKTYPNGVHALRDVSLTIAPGMFGLLGPNGAGKSTLMRILATLQEADSGAAHLGDIDVLRDKEAVRRTLGYLPQEFGLYPKATAEELLAHFAILKGVVDARERRDVVRSLLEQTNLYEARSRRLGSFSGGMRQRFGIAVALIGNPRLIIVDEPTAGLDPAERVRFLNLLSALGENAVVILSTHIVEDVSDLCSRMAIIQRGRILLEAEPQQAVRAIRGQVWRREVPRDELEAFEATHPHHPVITTTLLAGRTVVHVHGDTPPEPSFQPVEPDLKDVYFTVMGGIPIGRQASPSPEPPPIPGTELPMPGAEVLSIRDVESAPIASAEPLAIGRAEAPPMPSAEDQRIPSPVEPPVSSIEPPPVPSPEPPPLSRTNDVDDDWSAFRAPEER
ncbi:ABC transporter ATP-binding protein [Longimicrobium sp.]|uniref:ABC transporter ATP-binding protein n=1 Tax=Longimicrobium sp. TaxID=2029185 RepID=UPI002E37F32F|nr:ABC transporter ATP-binding protein [Longimicrobium sp.]HEX6041429.1 ABC transporter ATP-binding protein [Longimicrobium sp.]